MLRQFSGSRLLPLGWTRHVAVDSQGNIFVADEGNGCILLLDSQLALRRVISVVLFLVTLLLLKGFNTAFTKN